MKPSNFLWLLVSFLILSGCSGQASSLTQKDVHLVNIEGCGLDQFFNEKTSTCERELAIDTKQDIEVFLDAIEKGTVIDGPLTTEGNNFEFTLVQENEETTQYKVWINGNTGSFEKSQDENVRYLFQEEDVQKIFNIIEREMKENPNSQ